LSQAGAPVNNESEEWVSTLREFLMFKFWEKIIEKLVVLCSEKEEMVI